MLSRVIYACDVGSIRGGSFAWSRIEPDGLVPTASTSIDDVVPRLLADVGNGASVALGFESPLFMPIPIDSIDLNRGRVNEGNRSMFAPAAASVTTLGVHEAAWILRAIRDQAVRVLTYTLDWKAWPPTDGTRLLLLWEAFVSGPAHGLSHEQDAATAAVFFRDREDELDAANAVTAGEPLSLIHAAALWAGWSNDLARLHEGCLVLRPTSPYDGQIDPD